MTDSRVVIQKLDVVALCAEGVGDAEETEKQQQQQQPAADEGCDSDVEVCELRPSLHDAVAAGQPVVVDLLSEP